MENIRKVIEERCGNGVFIDYIYEEENHEYSIEHVMAIRDEVKKDFPELADKHLKIKVDELGIVVTFYIDEILNINFVDNKKVVDYNSVSRDYVFDRINKAYDNNRWHINFKGILSSELKKELEKEGHTVETSIPYGEPWIFIDLKWQKTKA